ncbi:MAG TPA: glutamine-hydrolyzing GMP synthase [Sphaerochaeta sp.]|nr:glutamine-hydrolyzing GMP synthase [Sphaerochaeta sp.]
MDQVVAIYTDGSDQVHKLARFVRSLGFYSQVVFTQESLAQLDVVAVLLCGETASPKTEVKVLAIRDPNAFDEKVIDSFLCTECALTPTWSMERFIELQVDRIRQQVGEERVLLGLSGGVDSSVAALLIHRAIGEQLVCVFVDNGLLRKGEREMVEELFGEHYQIKLITVDSEEHFLQGLAGISDPEEKRKIIGSLFVESFYGAVRAIGDIGFLAQGTIYADVIESENPAKQGSLAIKSHHNVGGLPDDLKWKLLEPLRELFKDEVRELGRCLGLSEELLSRHPFPGPGLGVRCVGAITAERLATLREIDAIFIEEIRKAGLYDEIFQAIACLLPVKSVGVRDGKRTHQEVCSIRAVESVDAITAQWYPFAHKTLRTISQRILAEVSSVSRVLYDISDKPPATIEWE